MKRNTKTILLLSVAGMLLTSCGTSGSNTLFDTASPESSVMEIYSFDGKQTTVWRISDNPAEEEMLEKLTNTSAVPAEDVTTEDVTSPVYGFSIGSTDGWGLGMAWSNGHLYNRDGEVYEFDFDFGEFLETYAFEEEWTFDGMLMMPCSRYLVQDENGWNAALMDPYTNDFPVPDGIALEIAFDGEKIDAVFRNEGPENWGFGAYYFLHVNLDGVWYEVPTSPAANWGFPDIGYELAPGGEWTETYSLDMYGELPAGQYRFMAYGLTAEFTVE